MNISRKFFLKEAVFLVMGSSLFKQKLFALIDNKALTCTQLINILPYPSELYLDAYLILQIENTDNSFGKRLIVIKANRNIIAQKATVFFNAIRKGLK